MIHSRPALSRSAARKPPMKMSPRENVAPAAETVKNQKQQDNNRQQRGLVIPEDVKPTVVTANEQRVTPTFECFLELPPELRIKIWQEAMPGPRIIPIVHDESSEQTVTGYDHDLSQDGTTAEQNKLCRAKAQNATVPALLQANRESRGEATKLYTLAFGKQLRHGPVWFDFDHDEICFPTLEDLESFFGELDRNYLHCGATFVDMKDVEDRVRFVACGEEFISSIPCAFSRFSRLAHLTLRKIPHDLELRDPGISAICERYNAEQFAFHRADAAEKKNLCFAIPNIEYLSWKDFTDRYSDRPRSPHTELFLIYQYGQSHARIERMSS